MSYQSSSRERYGSLLTLAAVIGSYSTVGAAQDQSQSADSASTAQSNLEEVIVTANKREGRLQDVPSAVTAISAEQVTALAITDATSLSRVAPSLAAKQGGGAPEAQFSMRGLSSAYLLMPVVSVYVDEIPLDFRNGVTSSQTLIDFFDVQRIEVLRGPQGTIFGSSSLAGAVRLVTTPPDTSGFGMSTDLQTSTTQGGGESYWAKGAINVPFSDDAALRLVATRSHDGGWVDTVRHESWSNLANLPIAKRDVDSSDTTSARATLLWTPTDALTIKPMVIYQKTEFDGLSTYSFEAGKFKQPNASPNSGANETTIGSLVLDYDFDSFTLTSASTVTRKRSSSLGDYSEFGERFAGSVGLVPRAYVAPIQALTNFDGYSQELRATSAGSGPLTWIAGAYYSYNDGHDFQRWTSDAYVPAVGTSELLVYDVSEKDEQVAVFGEATYAFTERFEFSVGARFYRSTSELTLDFSGPFAGPDTPKTKATSDGVSPRVSASFKPSSQATVYATYSEGFRIGGANKSMAETANPAVDCSYYSLFGPAYEPDESQNYEVGVKTQFLPGLTLNLALYQLDWSNFATDVNSSCGGFIANLGDARSRGVELETQIRLVDNVTIYGGGAYTDGEITSVPPEVLSAGVGAPGDRLIDSPKLQGNLGAQIDFPLANSSEIYVRANWQYMGETPTDYALMTPAFELPSYVNLDSAIGYRTDTWNLELFGRNLTNELQLQRIADARIGDRNLVGSRPRTFGINFRYFYGQR